MRWRSAASLGLVSLSLLAAAAPADASTVEIGAAGKVAAGDDPTYVPPFALGRQFAVQSADGPLAPSVATSYAVPAGYGVITQWSHSSGGVAGSLLLTVWRKPGDWTAVANETRSVAANTVQRFNTRIPVRAGDRLGLGSEVGNLAIGFSGFNPNTKVAELVDHDTTPQGAGTTRNGYALSVSARVETDADGDGFGDDTQDGCPTRADLQTACPPGQGGPGPGGTGKDQEKPNVSRPKLSVTVFRAAGSGPAFTAARPVGTRVSFTASEAGSVKFRVARRASGRKVGKKCNAPTRRNRKRKKCGRYVTGRGSFTIAATPGTNSFTFRGRIGGRKLSPGRYRLTGSATDRAGNVATVPARAFRIVR